jgi:hypothetical protein
VSDPWRIGGQDLCGLVRDRLTEGSEVAPPW